MPDQISGLLSPFLRSRRLAATRQWFGGGRLLDVGCGIGRLADEVPAERYVGFDLDADSVATARGAHPAHTFYTLDEFQVAESLEPFDVILALAVIEHVPDPGEWLTWLRGYLAPGGHVVLTTPHPRGRQAHEFGARLGLFSRAAAEEHEDFLDAASMRTAGDRAGLTVVEQRSFLFGVNQLFVLAEQPPPA